MTSKLHPRWLPMLELGITGALAPWFIVPSLGFQPWMMVIPLVLWGLRLLTRRELTCPTPLDAPILGMSVMVGVSFLVTYDTALSLPKAVGIFYGIILYFALSNNLSWPLTKRLILPGVLLAGWAIAGLSLFGMRWSSPKLPFIGVWLTRISTQIPRIMQNIPRAEKGINTNQLGGTLILFIPLQATYFIFAIRAHKQKVWEWIRAIGSGTGLALSLFVLLLTQSRGALAAGMVALCAIPAFYLRHKWQLILALLVLGIVLGSALIFSAQSNAFLTADEADIITESLDLKNRPEIWARATRMLQDHPYTGIGFDTFPTVLAARYPKFTIPLEFSKIMTHSHNLYLQVGLDLGIPGLIAFLAVNMVTGWMLLRSHLQTRSALIRATATGLLLGLSAQLLYGWVDAIALGQKASIFFWVYLAMSTVIFKAHNEQQTE